MAKKAVIVGQVAVKQDEAAPVLPEILASSIVKLGDGVMQWYRAGMKQRALILLLHDVTKVPKRDIEYVLNALKSLESEYCIPANLRLK